MNLTPPPITEKHIYEDLDRITLENGTRFYATPGGGKVSSVTTILSATSDNKGLVEWRNRIGNKAADEIMTEACNLGSLMHEHLESYVQNLERPKGNNFLRVLSKKMADKIIENGLPNVDEIWGMEKMLYFPDAYAGTTDLVGLHNGEPAIMDYKSARKMKERSKIEDYFCQACAYALAHNHLHGTNIKKGVIFMVDRDLNYKEFILEGEEFEYFTSMWINRLEAFLKNQSQKKAVI